MQNTSTSIAPDRIWSFYVVIALALLGAAYQLVRLQITGFDAYTVRAIDNRQQRQRNHNIKTPDAIGGDAGGSVLHCSSLK